MIFWHTYYSLSPHLHLGFVPVSVSCHFLHLLVMRIFASMALEGLGEENKSWRIIPGASIGWILEEMNWGMFENLKLVMGILAREMYLACICVLW